MNIKKYFWVLMIIICLSGCKSILVNKTIMHTATTTPVALGVIGIHNNQLLHSDFRGTTIPDYTKGIRIKATITDFNQTTYKSYRKACKNNELQIKYIDSIKNKPQFITLEVIDWAVIQSELTATHNQTTIQYLKHQNDAMIVGSVSAAMNTQALEEINTAEAIFLTNKDYKQYEIALVKDGKTYKTIDFSDTTIFGYQLATFCWGENEKRRIALVDIVDEKQSCPRNTYKNAEKAKGKIKYLKL